MNESQEDNLDQRLCEYLDGRLTRRQRRRLERDLEADGALREELRKYGALDGYLADLAEEQIEGVDYDRQRAEIIAAVERKTLLAPVRHRWLDRWLVMPPAFVPVAAAAALLVLVVSAALFLFGPDRSVAPAPSVSVEMLPAAPRPGGPVEVSVTLSRPSFDDLPLAPGAAPAAATPSGTIVVSVSGEAPPAPAPVETMVVF